MKAILDSWNNVLKVNDCASIYYGFQVVLSQSKSKWQENALSKLEGSTLL